MKIEVNGKEYDVIINKKVSTKNIYIRVKDDLKIYVTANSFTSDKKIIDVIKNNYKFIKKRIEILEKRNSRKDEFYYLGKKYEIVYSNNKSVLLGEDKVLVNPNYDINKWYRIKAQEVFKKELDRIYELFPYDIPYPSLTIREMKTRWGVCNTKLKKITLNLGLIKKDLIYLDYVIVHELSHLIYANHSKDFWSVVEEVMPDYKKIRKELKKDE